MFVCFCPADLLVYTWSASRKWALLPFAGSDQPSAQISCQNMGGNLLSITSDTERLQLMSSSVGTTWTGLQSINRTRTTDRSKFIWLSTHLAPTYTYWANGEPSNSQNNEGICVEAWVAADDGRWNDAPCEWIKSFGCDLPGEGVRTLTGCLLVLEPEVPARALVTA